MRYGRLAFAMVDVDPQNARQKIIDALPRVAARSGGAAGPASPVVTVEHPVRTKRHRASHVPAFEPRENHLFAGRIAARRIEPGYFESRQSSAVFQRRTFFRRQRRTSQNNTRFSANFG